MIGEVIRNYLNANLGLAIPLLIVLTEIFFVIFTLCFRHDKDIKNVGIIIILKMLCLWAAAGTILLITLVLDYYLYTLYVVGGICLLALYILINKSFVDTIYKPKGRKKK